MWILQCTGDKAQYTNLSDQLRAKSMQLQQLRQSLAREGMQEEDAEALKKIKREMKSESGKLEVERHFLRHINEQRKATNGNVSCFYQVYDAVFAKFTLNEQAKAAAQLHEPEWMYGKMCSHIVRQAFLSKAVEEGIKAKSASLRAVTSMQNAAQLKKVAKAPHQGQAGGRNSGSRGRFGGGRDKGRGWQQWRGGMGGRWKSNVFANSTHQY